jgi:hypothetical protein
MVRVRKVPPLFRPAFFRLAQNYIAATKISGEQAFGWGKDFGWSRAIGPASDVPQNNLGFSP